MFVIGAELEGFTFTAVQQSFAMKIRRHRHYRI